MESSILNILSRIQSQKVDLGITLYKKASQVDISFFQNTVGINLPNDVRTFYSFCDGFESAEDNFRIVPLAEILEMKHGNKPLDKNDFHIAEYMSYCDMWTMAVDNANSNNYTIYNKTESSVILTSSFAELLDRFLNKGVFEGLFKWREEFETTESKNITH